MISTWVKLYGILNELAHVLGISFVASHFGQFLLTDAIFAKQGCLDFVQVCVKLDARLGISKETNFFKSSSEPYTVSMEYEWLPLLYPFYEIFKHFQSNCPCKQDNGAMFDPIKGNNTMANSSKQE